MNQPYKSICLLACIGMFPVVFFSCSGNYGSPCEAYNCNTSYEGYYQKSYGSVSFTDSSNNKWLAYAPNEETAIEYGNDKGFVFRYTMLKSSEDDKTVLRSYDGPKDQCCPYPPTYYDYFRKQSETVFYTSQNAGFDFSAKREMNVKAELSTNDSLVVHSTDEILSFHFNNHYFSIDPASFSETGDQLFHDSIMLRNNTYDSVYQIIDTHVDDTKILLKGFYFSFSKGIFGFYLTNGELWLQD